MAAGAPTAGRSVRVWGRLRKSPKSHDFGYNVYPRIFPFKKILNGVCRMGAKAQKSPGFVYGRTGNYCQL